MRRSPQLGEIITARFNGETVLLIALFAVVWLRLVLPAMNFGQPIAHVMHDADAMAFMLQPMDRATGSTDTQMPSDQRCRDTIPGCNSYLQGLCPFAPVFVVTGCVAFAPPPFAQAAPLSLATDDLSPPGSEPKIPPRP